MDYGSLRFNYDTQRYLICNEVGIDLTYGGLHCGFCFDALIDDRWVPVRLEYGNDWYLVGHPGLRLDGLKVRI